jgi:hypothetical protein
MPSGGVENLAARRGSSHPRGSTGLGHDIRAGLMDPRETQLRALRRIVCHLLIRHNGTLIAYGAGRTDPIRSAPSATSAATSRFRSTRSWTPNSTARSKTPTRSAGSPS